ncbi:hypothetical protein ACJX0J_038609, partial [Zea mays]
SDTIFASLGTPFSQGILIFSRDAVAGYAATCTAAGEFLRMFASKKHLWALGTSSRHPPTPTVAFIL